ncbi:putative membrane protein [Collimonas fungivorans]|uniref:Putative membrane protein n=1 Tax=Collimonas fungivorans TaxID=158899 RepID=A0A127PDQ4_9BURK|nr:putative membrane protein [Collimonas fungivorans]
MHQSLLLGFAAWIFIAWVLLVRLSLEPEACQTAAHRH